MKRFLTWAGGLIGHIVILILVFILSILIFNRMINKVAPDEAAKMADTTFPLVYMNRNGVSFNCLHGYAHEMDVTRMRDSVTPLTSDRKIDIRVQTFSTSVEGISYEVMSLDGKESLEKTKVIKLDSQDGYLNATLQLQDKLLMEHEYVLRVQVTTGGREIHYYTNVVLADGLHTDEYLNFVAGFTDKTVNKTDLDTVGAAVEPDATTDSEQTLAYMDIHDSVSQLTWADLNPQIYYKATPQICEINKNTATLKMEYQIAAVNDAGKTEIYNVDEAYRVRYTDSRVFLLNFERTTDQVFDPDNDVLTEKGIVLGVTGKTVNYNSDEKGRVIAFVQENALWTYSVADSKLTEVFSFPQGENMDYRDFYDGSIINILKVTTEGDVWFTIAGYMNRGAYEGENGIDVCYYEASTDMVDERAFLRTGEGISLLERDAAGLGYINNAETAFYTLLEGSVYKIDLKSREQSVVIEGVKENCHAVSRNGRYFAWLTEGVEYGSSTLNEIDLESEKITKITAPDGEKIKPVCFMNEDLVYGLAKDSDLAITTLTSGFFPMYELVFVDGSGGEKKRYTPENCYVTEIEQTDNMLNLIRIQKNAAGDGYEEASADQIVNTNNSKDVAMGVATDDDARRQTIVILRVGTTISDTKPEVVQSKIINYENRRIVEIPDSTQRELLYDAYIFGKLYDRFANPAEAIACADTRLGYVVDSNSDYVWVRGDKSTTADISLEKIPQVLRNGTTDLDLISGTLGREVMDLTGCTLDQVLYFVSHGKPVLAKTDEGYVTILGYDEYNTHLVDPNGSEWYYYGINDSTEMFAAQGNIFYTYIGDVVSAADLGENLVLQTESTTEQEQQ